MRKKTNVYGFKDKYGKQVFVTGSNQYEAALRTPERYREQVASSKPVERNVGAKGLKKYQDANKYASTPISKKEKARRGFESIKKAATSSMKSFDREGFSKFLRG